MAGTREQAIANLKKAWESPDIGKRGPSKTTIDKEKAREIYLDRLAESMNDLTAVHIIEATDPKNAVERMYALNQLVGKPVEKMEVEQTTTLKVDV